ncbi:hypothetical protein [Helicobacter sp. T3_23-1056]
MKCLIKITQKSAFFLLFASISFLSQGCKNSEVSQKSFSYTSLDSSYEIAIETPLLATNTAESPLHINSKNLKEKLILEKNSKAQNRIIMLVFMDIDCDDCARYYEHLNRLDAESKAMIVGVLAKKIDEHSLAGLQKKYEIGFPLLNPKSNNENELLDLLVANKNARIQNDFKNISNVMPSQNTSTPAKKDFNEQSSQDKTNKDSAQDFAKDSTKDSSQDSSKTPKSSKLPALPYFVLFDKSQIFFQDYEGIIPEEIFSSDIASLSR